MREEASFFDHKRVTELPFQIRALLEQDGRRTEFDYIENDGSTIRDTLSHDRNIYLATRDGLSPFLSVCQEQELLLEKGSQWGGLPAFAVVEGDVLDHFKNFGVRM